LGYMEASRNTKIPLNPKLRYTPTKGTLGICLCSTIRWVPGDRTSRSLDASLAIPTCVLCFEASRRAQIPSSPAEPQVLVLWLNQVTPRFCGELPQTPRTLCSLHQSPLMTRLPRSPDSTLVLRLNQETVDDFILPFLPPCVPHLNPLATRSLERSLLVFFTPGGLTGNNLSRLFFT
jgi:hypothetical protein